MSAPETEHTTQEAIDGLHFIASRKRLLLIALGVTILYAFGVNDKWRFQRDSAVYMGLARSVVEDQSYAFNYEPHTKYTPGLPVFLAGTGHIFGVPDQLSDSFSAYNILITIFGLGCIGLFYLILRELNAPPTVFAIAFLFFCFSRTLYYYSIHIMSDVPFTFFSLATLLLGLFMLRREGWKSWAACVGATVMIIAAMSIKPVGPFLLVALTAGLWLRREALKKWKKRAGQTAILWILPGISLKLYSLWTHSLVSQSGAGKHYFRGKFAQNPLGWFIKTFFAKLPAHFAGLSDTLMGTELGTIVGIILAIVMLVGLIRSLKRGERQLSFFALILCGVIIAGRWKLNRRYLLPATPVMFYWLALGLPAIGRWLQRKWDFWTAKRVKRLGYICVGLVLLSNLVRVGDVILEERGKFYSEIERGKLASYKPVFAWLRQNGHRGKTVVGAYESAPTHYFTRQRTEHLNHNTRGWTEEKIAGWLQGVDFLIKDQTKPESTAALKKLSAESGLTLEPIDVGGTQQVQLLRVIAQNGSPEKEQENKR
ncbi:MAG: ArnT family glycosyltransferase [Candidatus Brocadiia bacterium]